MVTTANPLLRFAVGSSSSKTPAGTPALQKKPLAEEIARRAYPLPFQICAVRFTARGRGGTPPSPASLAASVVCRGPS